MQREEDLGAVLVEPPTSALGAFLFDEIPARVGPYFTASRDQEQRRRSTLVALTMMLFIIYNSFLVGSGFFSEGTFFTFMRTQATVLLLLQITLLYLFHRMQSFIICALFLVVVDLGCFAVCFRFGAVGEYLMWILYVPILLYYIRGSKAGLNALLFIIAQMTLFFLLSSYVILPQDDELKLLPAIHKWFVILMTYMIVGITTFVHETSRCKGITELRRREALNEQLQEAAEAKTGLLLNVSHEVRMPLCGIIASADRLLESEAVKDVFWEGVGSIKACAEHMLELVDSVVDISEMEAKRLSLESIAFTPKSEVDLVVKIFSSQAERKGVQLETTISLQHPARLGDPLRFRQILFNLLAQAINGTDPGGRVTIRMWDNFRSEEVYTEVEGTGVGMAPSALFDEGDASIARRYGGSGLGLTLSKRICESMGGHIGCTSSHSGKGTTFSFTVSLSVHAGTETMTFREDDDYSGPCLPSESLSQLRVLFVEDNKINQKVGLRMLRALGCHAKLAVNGAECLTAMKSCQYDLVLMDCQMPTMDGFQATRLIRDREAKQQRSRAGGPVRTPVIAITALATVEVKQQCIDAGMDDWMPKPFEKNKLCCVLTRWLKRRPLS